MKTDKAKLNADLKKFYELCNACEAPMPGQDEAFDALVNGVDNFIWDNRAELAELRRFLMDINFKHLAYIVSIIANGKYNYARDGVSQYIGVDLLPNSQPTEFFVNKIMDDTQRLTHFKAAYRQGVFDKWAYH